MRTLRAAALYFLAAFAAGFVLGALRTLLLEPRAGPTLAVAIELPVMLAISSLSAGPVLRRCGVRTIAGALRVGLLAWFLLQAAELAMAAALLQGGHGWTHAYLERLRTPAGLLGIAGQAVYAFIPALAVAGARDRPRAEPRRGRG